MPSARTLAAAGVTALLVVMIAPMAVSTAGCTGDDCDTDTQTWGSCTQGEKLDDNHWESGPIYGTYLDYPGGRTWMLDPSPWMGKRTPSAILAYLSFESNPFATNGTGISEAAGNLAEFLPGANPWQINVFNATCAAYYLRVVVEYPEGTEMAGTCTASDAATSD